MVSETQSLVNILIAAGASTAMVGYALAGRRKRGVRELWLVGGAIGAAMTCAVALADANQVVVDGRGLATAAVALSVGLLIAVRLVAFGLRGRYVGDHPHCRRCGFDLFGKPSSSVVCPECGADLNATRAITTGVRQRRPVPLLVGCFVLIVVSAYGSAVSRDAYRWASNYDWTPHKPDSWLVRDLFASGPTAPSQHAGDALSRRALAGTLGRTAAMRAIDQLLTQSLPWPTMPGVRQETMLALQIAEGAWSHGMIDEPTMRHVMQASLDCSLQVAPQASRGRTLRFWIAVGDYRLGRGQQFAGAAQTLAFRDRRDTLNDRPLPPPTGSSLRSYGTDWPADESLGNAFDLSSIGDALPPGPATLKTQFTASFTLVTQGKPTLIESRDVSLTGTAALAEPAAMKCPPIAVPPGTDPAAPVELVPPTLDLFRVNSDAKALDVGVALSSRGALLADVFLRIDGKDRKLDTIFIESNSSSATVRIDTLPAGPFELVFVPAPERGADLFTVVPTYQVPVVVPSSAIAGMDQ